MHQNSLATALREIGRIEPTLFTLRWFEDPCLLRLVTTELNKGEARNSFSRAVAFHRLGRFRDRGHESQSSRAVALNLVIAAIILQLRLSQPGLDGNKGTRCED